MVGKAAAFLCRYKKLNGVYSIKGTKTGIALLIMGGVPCQIDEMVPTISEMEKEHYQFEEILNNVETPGEAYKILKKAVR